MFNSKHQRDSVVDDFHPQLTCKIVVFLPISYTRNFPVSNLFNVRNHTCLSHLLSLLFSFQGTRRNALHFSFQVYFVNLLSDLVSLNQIGGLKWTRTTDLTLIRRAL